MSDGWRADEWEAIGRIEQRLGYSFRRKELLRRALTHRSRAHERGDASHYERLEFLGDSVLGLVTAEWLFRRDREHLEGELAKGKSWLVSAPSLARIAQSLEVGPCLQLGVGEERSGGREKESLLADAMEAILGALYLDGGLEPVRALLEPWLDRLIGRLDSGRERDYKTQLQELAQSRGWDLPTYRMVHASGPDHERHFRYAVLLQGSPAGEGEGPSKKKAQQAAAAAALETLDPA